MSRPRPSLALQPLEARDVPAFVAELGSDRSATFTGDASADTLEIFLDGSGLISHNRFSAGDPGFVSDNDFDSTSPGNQVIRVNAAASVGDALITVTDAGFNNDVLRYSNDIRIDDPLLGGSGRGDTFTFSANSLHHVTDSNDDQADNFNVRLKWDASLRDIQLFGTRGSDDILVIGQPNPDQTLRIDANGGANDNVFIGDDGPNITGSLDGIAGRINVVFATQTRVLDQLSSTGATYTVTSEGIARTKAGHPDLFVQLDAGFAGTMRLETSDGDDTVFVTGVPLQANNALGFLQIFTNGGADLVTVRPDPFTAVSVVGSGNDRLFVDAAGLTVESFDPIPQGRVRVAGRNDVQFEGMLSAQLLEGSLPPTVPPPPAVPPVTPPPVAPAAGAGDLLAVATGPGATGAVRVFNADGSTRFDLVPFVGFAGGLSVATGDVTGDGIDDVVVGASAGALGGHVKVFDGATGAEVWSFLAFDGFSGGVTVAAGDLDGGGRAEVVVGAGGGAVGGHVKAFDGATGAEVRSFFAFDGFDGGVNVAAGDVTGDGRADIVVGSARHVGHVKVFDGASGSEVRSFFAFDGPTDGVSVGTGDMNGDGFAEVVAGQRVGGSRVRTFDGRTGANRFDFEPFPGFAGGVSVAGHDRDGDGLSDIAVGAGPAGNGHTKVFSGLTAEELDSFLAFDGGSLAPVVVG